MDFCASYKQEIIPGSTSTMKLLAFEKTTLKWSMLLIDDTRFQIETKLKDTLWEKVS